MDILKSRIELQRMSRRDLFKMALNQKMSKCLIGGRSCSFYLQYKGNHFCVSEILGEGCQVERLEYLEEFYHGKENVNSLLPFLQKMETELSWPGKKIVEFNVYHKNSLARSAVFLGKIIERRRKERSDNLRDLLKKAIKQYSDSVEDPSTIFLLGK